MSEPSLNLAEIEAALRAVTNWKTEPLADAPVSKAMSFTGKANGWTFVLVRFCRWVGDTNHGVDGTALKQGMIVRISTPELRQAALEATGPSRRSRGDV